MRDDVFQIADPILVRMGPVPRSRTEQREHRDPRSRIRQVMADPLLREAILIASGSLSHSLAKIDSGAEPGEKKTLRAATSPTRHHLRRGGRPTPFGLFAGVAPGRLGPTARVEV